MRFAKRAVAGDRDIRIAGGADAIQQYLRAGLVDEFTLAISPVMFGGGARWIQRGRKTRSQAREVDRAPRLCAIECRGYGLCTA